MGMSPACDASDWDAQQARRGYLRASTAASIEPLRLMRHRALAVAVPLLPRLRLTLILQAQASRLNGQQHGLKHTACQH